MTDRILKWIPSVKNRKTAFLFCCTMFALSGGCSAPETEEASRNHQNPAKETISVTEQNDENSINTVQLNKEDISDWITAELIGSETETTTENIREWEKTNQGGFYKYWRKTVLKQIKGWEDIEDYKKTAEDIIKSCSIYKKICGSGKEEVETLLQNAEIISALAEDNEKIQNKYQTDIMAKRDTCVFQTHYIERQLEMSYSDNLAGKLQEEIESYQPDEYLDWLAYNVDYWMDEPICGDTCQMVIRTKTNEPFASAGAYYLAYMDTGETMSLIDGRGFRQEVPVCQLLGDGNIVENDFSQYVSNVDTCFSLCQKIEQILKTGNLENGQKYADSETKTDNNNSLNHSDSSDDLGDISQYYIIYDSNQRFLDDWDFDDMDSHTLCLARNEIYARHGRLFNDKEIQAYFNSMPWYSGTVAPEDFNDRVFNQYEKANLEKIAELESHTVP